VAEKIGKNKKCSPWRDRAQIIVIFLLHTWIRIHTHLFPHESDPRVYNESLFVANLPLFLVTLTRNIKSRDIHTE
jgi:hypothetical protein